MDDRIIIYTDGSVVGNGQADSKTGWAIIMIYKGVAKVKSGKGTVGWTNNQIEMYAVFKAMQSVTGKNIPVTIISDSQYVVKTFNGEFQIGSNEIMWKQLMGEKAKFTDIQFQWVKGHADNPYNNLADMIAFGETAS